MYTESNILQLDPFQTLDTDGVGQLIQLAVEQAKQVKPEIKIGVCVNLVVTRNQFTNSTTGISTTFHVHRSEYLVPY